MLPSISKFQYFMTVAVLVLALGAAGCVTEPHASVGDEKVEISFFIFAGANQGVVPREVGEAYMEEHPNVSIKFVESSNALIYPQMVSHKNIFPEEPLINIGYFNAEKTALGDIDDMWIALDEARIPNMADVLPVSLRENGKGVATSLSPVGLMYNSETCPTPPTSWLDMINPEYEGKMVLWDYLNYQNIMVLAHVLTGDHKNVDAAFEAWSENIDMIHSLQTGNEGLKQALVTGGGCMAPRSRSLEKPWEEDSPIRYSVPEEGQYIQPIYLQIVKGSTEAQIQVAEDLVNMLLSPEWAGRDAELQNEMPVNTKAVVPDAVKNDPAYSPEAVEKYWNIDWVWAAEVNQDLTERWDREVKAKMR